MNRNPKLGIIRVQLSNEGFINFWEDGKTEMVKWPEIERIFAYKVDCFTYDVIWLAFERRENDKALRVSEEIPGFQDLMAALARAFPEINPEWYLNVMQPPFAEKLTVLFEHKAEARDGRDEPI